MKTILLISFVLITSFAFGQAGSKEKFGNYSFQTQIGIKDISAPTTPLSGYGWLYVNGDSLRFKNDAGTVFTLGIGGGSGYTTLAQFVGETNWTTGYINGSGDYTELPLGGSGKVLTSNGASSAPTWETPTGGTIRLDQLLAANTTNDINSGDNEQIWRWNGLVGNNGLNLMSSSTAVTGSEKILNLSFTGTNATGGVATTALNINNSKAGTGADNSGFNVNVSGGQANTGGNFFINGASGVNANGIFLDVSGASGENNAINIGAGVIKFAEMAAPGTPTAGNVYIYPKSDGKLYSKDDAGTEYDLTSGGGATTFAALTDVNLTSITTNDFLKWDGSDWINRSPSQVRSDLSLVIGTNVQAWDADLDTWAGVTPGTGVATFLATPSSANLKTAVTDETGSAGVLVFSTGPTLTSPFITTDISPTSNDGATLGVAIRAFSDLYLADGANINFNNGNTVLVHSSGILTVSTGDLRMTTAGTNSASVATVGGTQTLTNKRITKRTATVASSATPTINTDNVDFFTITALAVDITNMSTNLSGTPTTGDRLEIWITGTATRAIAWGASFTATTVALPTTTSSTATLKVFFIRGASTWEMAGYN